MSAALLSHWRAQGLRPAAVKPVATGYNPARPEDSDGAALLAGLGRFATRQAVEAITPFRFAAPLSPDQAARRQGARLTAAAVAAACRPHIADAQGPVLVEGAGGIMSPLNEAETMLDLAAELALPVIFVAGSYLGALSHALTGLAVLRARGVTAALTLVNETPQSPVDLEETCLSLKSQLKGLTALALPRAAGDGVWAEASAILLGAGPLVAAAAPV